MVSGYGANLIFLNKKIKDWTSRMVANSHVQQHLISCLVHPPHPPSRQSGRHSYVYHPLQKAGFSINNSQNFRSSSMLPIPFEGSQSNVFLTRAP